VLVGTWVTARLLVWV